MTSYNTWNTTSYKKNPPFAPGQDQGRLPFDAGICTRARRVLGAQQQRVVTAADADDILPPNCA